MHVLTHMLSPAGSVAPLLLLSLSDLRACKQLQRCLLYLDAILILKSKLERRSIRDVAHLISLGARLWRLYTLWVCPGIMQRLCVCHRCLRAQSVEAGQQQGYQRSGTPMTAPACN